MQLTIRMPDKEMVRIEQIAKKLGLKKTDVTRMALNKFLEDYDRTASDRPFSKVSHLLGIAESGVPDLGQRHRNHLTNRIKDSQD